MVLYRNFHFEPDNMGMFRKVFVASVAALSSVVLLTGCTELDGVQEMLETTFGVTPTTEHGVQRETTSYMNDAMRLTVKDWVWQEPEGVVAECATGDGQAGYLFNFSMNGLGWNGGNADAALVRDLWASKGLDAVKSYGNVTGRLKDENNFILKYSSDGKDIQVLGSTRCIAGSLVERSRNFGQ